MKSLVRKSKINKILSLALIAILSVSAFILFTNDVHAASLSGYASKNMNNSYSYTQYSSSAWGKSNFWDVENHWEGTGRTAWKGSSPYNADSITHKDVLSVTGIGSMSFGGGISASGPSGSMSFSVSGHSATQSYTLQNVWSVNSNYHYTMHGLLASWNQRQRAEATVQLGNTFYSWGT